MHGMVASALVSFVDIREQAVVGLANHDDDSARNSSNHCNQRRPQCNLFRHDKIWTDLQGRWFD